MDECIIDQAAARLEPQNRRDRLISELHWGSQFSFDNNVVVYLAREKQVWWYWIGWRRNLHAASSWLVRNVYLLWSSLQTAWVKKITFDIPSNVVQNEFDSESKLTTQSVRNKCLIAQSNMSPREARPRLDYLIDPFISSDGFVSHWGGLVLRTNEPDRPGEMLLRVPGISSQSWQMRVSCIGIGLR